jgi:YggT family protein
MNPFLELFITIIDLYKLILIVWIIMSWLINFNIINRYQPLVSRVYGFLNQVTYPILGRMRDYIPLIGSIDLSPIVLFLILNFLKSFIYYYLF